MFLITAVIAAGVLINAVFPVVYQMTGTFASATHSSDERLRSDFGIVATFASGSNAQVYMKNIGSRPVPLNEIEKSDVFFGSTTGTIERLDYPSQWTYRIHPTPSGYWTPGDTLEIDIHLTESLNSGEQVYFQFILPNAVQRSTQFGVGT
jgi:archaeal flagellar protein FlaG